LSLLKVSSRKNYGAGSEIKVEKERELPVPGESKETRPRKIRREAKAVSRSSWAANVAK